MPSTAVPPRDSGAASTLPARTGHRGVSILRTAALVLVVAAFVWLALTVRLPGVDELRAQLDGFGWWSWLAFTVLYAAVALTPIPVTIMAVTAGVLFGAIEGTVLSVVGALWARSGRTASRARSDARWSCAGSAATPRPWSGGSRTPGSSPCWPCASPRGCRTGP